MSLLSQEDHALAQSFLGQANPLQVVLANALPVGTAVMELKCPGDGNYAYHGMEFCFTQMLQREGLSTITGHELQQQLANVLREIPDLQIGSVHVVYHIANEARIDLDALGEDVVRYTPIECVMIYGVVKLR